MFILVCFRVSVARLCWVLCSVPLLCLVLVSLGLIICCRVFGAGIAHLLAVLVNSVAIFYLRDYICLFCDLFVSFVLAGSLIW